ncbi:hypothetical protein B5S28_g1229 [[Candida] boidinii]|nr:hypothetical protein B5S28_g1229 [[Candida] boidinii]OWB61500.1 hypothetical protein B5S29_g2392 [[Candida] boidinii]GMF01515.1 unnamed protein product [[Candida] boidinii]
MDQVSYYIEKQKERNSDVGQEIDIDADGEADTDTVQSTSSNEDNNSRKIGNKKAHLISRSSSTSASPPKKRQLRGRKARSYSDDDTTSDNQSNSSGKSKKNNSNNANVNNNNANNNDLKKKKRSLTTTIETKYNVGFKPKKVTDTNITKLIEKINSNINFKILNRKTHKQENYSDLIKNITTPINFYKLAKEVKFPLNDPNTNNNIRKVLEFRDTLQQLNVPENEYHEYTLSLIQFLQYYILSNNYRQQRGGSKKNKKTNTFIHRFLCRTVKTKENPNNNNNNNNSSDTRNSSPSDDGKEKNLNHNHLGKVSSEILDVNGCTRCPWNEIFYFNFSENWVKIQIKGSHQNHTFDRILKDRSCVLLDNYVKDMIDPSITTEVNSDSVNEDNNFENLDSKLDHDVLEKIGAFFFKGKKVDYLKKKRKLEKELSTEGKINGGVNNVNNDNNSEIGNVNIANKKKDDVPDGNNTRPLNSETETGNNTKNKAVVNSNNPEINREINLIMDANETSTNNAIMAASNPQPNAKSVKYHPHPHSHYHHHAPERRIKHEEKSLKDLLNSESDSSDSLEMKCDKNNDDQSCNNGSKIEIIRNDDDSDMGGINSVSGSNSDTNSMNGMDTSEKNGSVMANSRSSRMRNMSNDPSSASSASTSNPDSNSNSNPDSSGSSPPSNTGGSNDNGSDTNINYELNGNQDNNNVRNNSVSSTFLNSSNSSSSSSSMGPSSNVGPSLTITALTNKNDNNNYDEVTYKTGADNKVVYTSETAPLDNNTNDNGINNKSGTTQNNNGHNGIGFMSKMRDMQERGLRKTFDSCLDQIHGLQDLFYDLNDSELSREDKLLFNMKLAKELKATFEKSMEISKNIKQSAKSKKP